MSFLETFENLPFIVTPAFAGVTGCRVLGEIQSFQAVTRNAKALARALRDAGLQVAGDPAISFTKTHQVIVKVEYAKAVEAARRLEESNIICNYQAAPDEEGFTAAGALRLGVQEMTRFGMGPEDSRILSQYIYDENVT